MEMPPSTEVVPVVEVPPSAEIVVLASEEATGTVEASEAGNWRTSSAKLRRIFYRLL